MTDLREKIRRADLDELAFGIVGAAIALGIIVLLVAVAIGLLLHFAAPCDCPVTP